jgi:hypothetical protein
MVIIAINSKMMLKAPLDTEIVSYVIGGFKQDITKDSFTGFKL